jgi:hypothetical protein
MTTLPEFQIPKISSEDVADNRGTFTVEPLDKGFGYTFGNSLRRVLLWGERRSRASGSRALRTSSPTWLASRRTSRTSS